MNPIPAICDYAVLRFLPHLDRGAFVNVGVVENHLQPGFLEFKTETRIPERYVVRSSAGRHMAS